jgi:hypothetical protein
MPACPDCSASDVALFGGKGSGKCSACGGDGKNHSFINEVAAGFADADLGDCETCEGSGKCQRCSGTGKVDDDGD